MRKIFTSRSTRGEGVRTTGVALSPTATEVLKPVSYLPKIIFSAVNIRVASPKNTPVNAILPNPATINPHIAGGFPPKISIDIANCPTIGIGCSHGLSVSG